MPVPNYPSIPVPTDDPKALLESVLALKQAVEMLTGQDTAEKFAAHVFVQPEMPTALNAGDLWLCTAAVMSFNVWTGAVWVKVANVVAAAAETDFLLARFQRRRP